MRHHPSIPHVGAQDPGVRRLAQRFDIGTHGVERRPAHVDAEEVAARRDGAQTEGLQALIQQTPQGGGMGQWEEIGNWHGRPANK